MLYHEDRHEPLIDAAWSEAHAWAAIGDIVRDLESQSGDGVVWPVHPNDDEGDTPAGGFKGLYLGAAGILWALWYLQRVGSVKLTLDPIAAIRRAVEEYFEAPDTGAPCDSLFSGASGVLLVASRLTGENAWADRLFAKVESNLSHPSNEAFLGTSGTALAAWHLWRQTGEARWRELFAASQDRVWSTWTFDDEAGCFLWTQDLFGARVQYLGAGHGLAGNVATLLTGGEVSGSVRYRETLDRTVAMLEKYACRESGATNWPIATITPRPGRPHMLMQWCHGAPGFVTSLARVHPGESPALDSMLNQAGEAIWRAGPLRKGSGLCHGTAGNGEALLGLYARTGDVRWLERARAFAMHAVVQQQRERAIHGAGRCSLWTGDAGLAVFLWQCITGKAGVPTLDFLS